MVQIIEEERDEAAGLLQVSRELVDELLPLVEGDERSLVLNLVVDLSPGDLAQLVAHLPVEAARRLFDWLPPEQSGPVLVHLECPLRERLVEDVDPARQAALLQGLPTDDAADVLACMRQEQLDVVLPLLDNAAVLRALLHYPEDSAGGLMQTELVAVRPQQTVAEATEVVRRASTRVPDIISVFVRDERRRLRGTVSLQALLLAQEEARIEEIMETEVVSVAPEVDQEEVARLMERHDLFELPVLDPDRRLLGRITIDDVVDVIREEAEEDMQRLSGLPGAEGQSDSVLRISRGRLPWLLVGLVGAGLAGLVIGTFDQALERAVVLATFIPVVMAMAGNAGIQSSSIILQGIASGDLWTSDAPTRLAKELLVALINGAALSLLLAGAVLLLPLDTATPVRLALTAGISLMIVIVLATVVGSATPLVLHRLKIDPALATGPFITTSNDVLSLGVYFIVAKLLYL